MRHGFAVWALVTLRLGTPASAALVQTIAGGSVGDGLPATSAPVNATGVAVAANGDVYLSDGVGVRVRRVDATTGLISTVVGGGTPGPACALDGPARDVCLGQPRGLAFDGDGRLLIADRTGVLLRYDPATALVTHVAGNRDTLRCVPAEGVPATDGCIAPSDAVADATGTIFVVSPPQVHRIDPVTGLVDVYAGRPVHDRRICGEGGPALLACLGDPDGLALDGAGNLLVASADAGRIWRIDRASGILQVVAGHGDPGGCFAAGDNGPATAACVFPLDVVADAGGNILFQDRAYGEGLRRIDAVTGVVTLLGPGGGTRLALDAQGNLFAAASDVTRRDATTGTVTTVAGNHTSYHCGDGLLATEACLSYANGLAYDPAGNLFILEEDRIRRVDAATNVISTFVTGDRCDDPAIEPAVPCLQSTFESPSGIVVDAAGDVLLATTVGNEDDGGRAIVQRIDHVTRAVTTVAGRCIRPERAGIPAIDACLDAARGLALEPDGDLLIAERTQVRRITAHDGRLSIVAGSGELGCSVGAGDGGPAVAACVEASDLAVDVAGNLFIGADSRVWRLDGATQTIRLVAGGGPPGRVLDGQFATAGEIPHIAAIAVDLAGNLVLADSHRLRLVEPSGTIVTVAGVAPPRDGPDACFLGGALDWRCIGATALTIDPAGRFVFADSFRRVVSRLTLLCGNGTLDPGEQCDDGNFRSGDGCDANCTPTSCGNGVLSPGEACDDGNTAGGDCCGPTCAFDPPDTACDDGNACTPDDRCTAAGSCFGGAYRFCGVHGPCGAPYCDYLTGECAVDVLPDRFPCSLGDGCNVGLCVDGECVAQGPQDCDDGDPCTADGCDVGECFHDPPALACACARDMAPVACANRVPRAVRRAFKRACRHAEALGPLTVPREPARAAHRIDTAERRKRLGSPCAEALRRRLDALTR